MKHLLWLVLLLAAPAFAANKADVTPGVWNGYAASTIVTRNHPSEAACVEALRIRGPGKYTCRTSSTVVVVEVADPPLPEPPAPPVSQVLFSDALAGKYASAQNGIDWDGVNANRGSVTITPDGLRFRFDANVINSFAEQRFVLPRMAEVWFAYDLTIPANYNHRTNQRAVANPTGCTGDCASNNKILNVWGGSYTEPTTVGMGVNTWPNGDGTSSASVYYWLGRDLAQHDWTAIPRMIERADYGKKIHYVARAYAGGFQMWKQRPGEALVQICDSKVPDWGAGSKAFDRGYFLGWANSGFTQQTDFVLSNVQVAASSLH